MVYGSGLTVTPRAVHSSWKVGTSSSLVVDNTSVRFGALGFGLWGLGFGVWDLGFGVQGIGFIAWGAMYSVPCCDSARGAFRRRSVCAAGAGCSAIKYQSLWDAGCGMGGTDGSTTFKCPKISATD